MNVLSQPVLCLNAAWQPLTVKTVKEAITAMLGDSPNGNPPAMAMDQEFALDDNGDPIWDKLIYSTPLAWSDWVKLPIRSWDVVVHTSKHEIRAPRVIIQPNYGEMPLVRPRASDSAIYRRDGMICQYTGRKLSRGEANLDHVIPRRRGGKNSFENLVVCDKRINSIKADRTPEEAGLKLIRKPVAPKAIPVGATVQILHPSWRWYSMVNK